MDWTRRLLDKHKKVKSESGYSAVGCPLHLTDFYVLHFAGSQTVKNLPAEQETQVQSLGQKDPPAEARDSPNYLVSKQQSVFSSLCDISSALIAQPVKNIPAMQEIGVQFLGQKDPLEKEMATYSSILAWRIPGTEEPRRLQSMGLLRIRHDWMSNTLIGTKR